MKGNKGKNRGMGERRATHTRAHRSFTRRSRDGERHDTFGGTIGALRARSEVIDLTEVTEPVIAEPFNPTPKGATVRTFKGDLPTKAAPATKRRTGRSTPWDGMAATLPWGVPGSPRTSVCA